MHTHVISIVLLLAETDCIAFSRPTSAASQVWDTTFSKPTAGEERHGQHLYSTCPGGLQVLRPTCGGGVNIEAYLTEDMDSEVISSRGMNAKDTDSRGVDSMHMRSTFAVPRRPVASLLGKESSVGSVTPLSDL